MADRTCSVPGCRRQARPKGLCWLHSVGATPAEHFWMRFKREASGCWTWTGSLDRYGYGRFRGQFNGVRYQTAHRFAYELLVGPIPDGLVIDHLCRNRACVNPAHMEPVTNRENVQRGETGRHNSRPRREVDGVAVCRNGHAMTPENSRVIKSRPHLTACIACDQARTERFKLRHAS